MERGQGYLVREKGSRDRNHHGPPSISLPSLLSSGFSLSLHHGLPLGGS